MGLRESGCSAEQPASAGKSTGVNTAMKRYFSSIESNGAAARSAGQGKHHVRNRVCKYSELAFLSPVDLKDGLVGLENRPGGCGKPNPIFEYSTSIPFPLQRLATRKPCAYRFSSGLCLKRFPAPRCAPRAHSRSLSRMRVQVAHERQPSHNPCSERWRRSRSQSRLRLHRLEVPRTRRSQTKRSHLC